MTLPAGLSCLNLRLSDSAVNLLLSVLKAVKQPRMPARQRDHPTVDEKVFDICSGLENVAVGDDNIRNLADVDRTHFVGNPEDLGRI